MSIPHLRLLSPPPTTTTTSSSFSSFSSISFTFSPSSTSRLHRPPSHHSRSPVPPSASDALPGQRRPRRAREQHQSSHLSGSAQGRGCGSSTGPPTVAVPTVLSYLGRRLLTTQSNDHLDHLNPSPSLSHLSSTVFSSNKNSPPRPPSA